MGNDLQTSSLIYTKAITSSTGMNQTQTEKWQIITQNLTQKVAEIIEQSRHKILNVRT